MTARGRAARPGPQRCFAVAGDAVAGAPDHPPTAVREAAWLPLLLALTAARPDWLAWKGYDSAIRGPGDVDSVAPGEAWPEITRVFVTWARDQGLGPVVICPHAPGLLHIIALPPGDDVYFELDVNRRKVFLGSTLFRPPDLLAMTYLDARGVRRLRPGAEGVLKLIQNGMRRGARVRWDQIEAKGILPALRQDPEGIREVAGLFGWASSAIVRGTDAVLEGRWDRPAMLAVEARSLAKAVIEPGAVAWRLRFRRQRRRCPVLRSVFDDGRRVPLEQRAAWLAEVASYGGHRVLEPGVEP